MDATLFQVASLGTFGSQVWIRAVQVVGLHLRCMNELGVVIDE